MCFIMIVNKVYFFAQKVSSKSVKYFLLNWKPNDGAKMSRKLNDDLDIFDCEIDIFDFDMDAICPFLVKLY